MLAVTDRVFSVSDIYGIVRHHLDVLAVEDSVLFLGHDIGNAGFARFEIVAQLLHSVCFPALGHCRLTGHIAQAVGCTPRIDCLGFQIIFHIVCGELHISICHSDFAIVINHLLPFAEILNDRVFGRRKSRSFKGRFAQQFKGIRRGHLSCGIRNSVFVQGRGVAQGRKEAVGGADRESGVTSVHIQHLGSKSAFPVVRQFPHLTRKSV